MNEKLREKLTTEVFPTEPELVKTAREGLASEWVWPMIELMLMLATCICTWVASVQVCSVASGLPGRRAVVLFWVTGV